jgi:hypothetical protein
MNVTFAEHNPIVASLEEMVAPLTPAIHLVLGLQV